jgi:hypothetical protein
MNGVITADIVNSRSKEQVEDWLRPLKKCLSYYGCTPSDWEVYRGDSFQLMTESASVAINASVHIKAVVRSIRDLDVRMAIGLGEVAYRADRITESNGAAFFLSGETFEQLKESEKNLALKTGKEDLDQWIGPTLELAAVVMNEWNPGTAKVVAAQMFYPEKSQTELAEVLSISQAAVSKALKRAHFVAIHDYIAALGAQIERYT